MSSYDSLVNFVLAIDKMLKKFEMLGVLSFSLIETQLFDGFITHAATYTASEIAFSCQIPPN